MTVLFACLCVILGFVAWVLFRECRDMAGEIDNLDDIATYWEAQAKRLAHLDEGGVVFNPPHDAWAYDRSMQGVA